jgi:hypothetical protein
VKQLGLEAGQSVEMGTIHAGDFMVCFFPIKFTVLVLLFIYRVFLIVQMRIWVLSVLLAPLLLTSAST